MITFILSTPKLITNFWTALRNDAIQIIQTIIPFCFKDINNNNNMIKHQIDSFSNLQQYYNGNNDELYGNISPNDYFDEHYKGPEFKHHVNKIQRSMSDNIYGSLYTYKHCSHCDNVITSRTHIYAYNDNIYCTSHCRSKQIQHDNERRAITRTSHSYSI
jgi:hypothetical protein